MSVVPEVTVVVASHERPRRLARLLDSLAAQTLAPERWEAIVVHDSGETTRALLRDHPLAREGRLTEVSRAPGVNPPGHQRNDGWRRARAPLIAFTDDDCRTHPGWLGALVAAAEAEPGAVVQGRTAGDPDDAEALRAPHSRTVTAEPPELFVQACNVLYPRALLERLEGFDESLPLHSGEDTDLALRAREAGARVVGAPDALVWHAIESHSLAAMIALNWKWRDLARVVKRHPQVRETLVLGVFWRPSHARLLLALAGVLAARRRPPLALLAAPYLRSRLLAQGRRPDVVARAAVRLPGAIAVELAEIATMLAGSARHRAFII